MQCSACKADVGFVDLLPVQGVKCRLMSGKQGGHGASGFPVFAALLIVAGVLLLLWNFHVLPEGMWQAIKKFWPVALLIVGVNIFLREKPWLAGFIILLILLATVGIAWYIASYHSDVLALAIRPS